jgi:hypothetical protein
MKRRQSGARFTSDELISRLVDHLDRQREAGECPTIIPTSVLEQLRDGQLDQRAAQKARAHMATCLVCRNAYAELAGATQALAGLSPIKASATAPVVSIEALVRKFVDECKTTLRSFRHREVQRSYSDPAYRFLASVVSDVAASYPPALDRDLEKIRHLERALQERLDELRVLKALLIRSDNLVVEIRRAGPTDSTRETLLAEVQTQRQTIVHALHVVTRV